MKEKTGVLLKSGFMCVFSCVTFIQDMILDTRLAIKYVTCNTHYFILTLIFFFVPGIITSVFSVLWHIQDSSRTTTVKFTKPLIVFKFICISLLVSPISGYINCFYLLIQQYKSDEDNENYKTIIDSLAMVTADVALLRLFESFLESTPQFILQLYIIIRSFHSNRRRKCSDYESELIYLESVGIAMSILSLGTSMTSYNLSLRKAQPGKMKHDIIGAVTLFFSYIFSISARILAITLGAIVIPSYTVGICGLHWFLMTLWLITIMGKSENITVYQLFNCMALAIVYIFVFINPEDKKTRNKYIAYYTICFTENLAMTITWCIQEDPESLFYYPGFLLHYCSFLMGILFQLLYYRFFHPSLQRTDDKMKSEMQMAELISVGNTSYV